VIAPDRLAADLLVVGSGPAGQKAAIQAAKAGAAAVVVERERTVGGACVHTGTIPSKSLREKALQLRRAEAATGLFDVERRLDVPLSALLDGVEEIVEAHNSFIAAQLARNGVRVVHGRGRFVSPTELHVTRIDGSVLSIEASRAVLATGSVPRQPPKLEIDHEHVLDSDSVLALAYLPRSLVVLGGGIVACEYATVFGALGCRVTIVDRNPAPLGFLDEELRGRFRAELDALGVAYVGERDCAAIEWDGVSQCVVRLDDGTELRADKVLVALGRVANVSDLGLDAAGIEVTERGHVRVDEALRTTSPAIFAAGDVIGPPALAATAMEQGRRAACHALGIPVGPFGDVFPAGVYTIPEIASVGLDERAARERLGGCLVGRAEFHEIARGQIGGHQRGFLKLVSDPSGRELLGVQVLGEGASELVHLGQLALGNGAGIDTFVENVFNFPTLAEAYRVAALDVVRQRRPFARAA
jgi:NAD(P) transhydrogenase